VGLSSDYFRDDYFGLRYVRTSAALGLASALVMEWSIRDLGRGRGIAWESRRYKRALIV